MAKPTRLLLALMLVPHGPLLAAGDNLLSLPLEQLTRLDVRVATGTPTPLAEAPAAATLLLKEDFRAMGAQTPEQALAAVPGLHIAPYSGLAGGSRWFIRGITSATNSQTLVLVNGIPMTLATSGSVTPSEGRKPISMVERIEAIRGPGSAVHGADAFAGVVNLVTKDAAALSGSRAGASVGSFDTTTAYVSQGGPVGNARAAFLLSWYGTRGANRDIPVDIQTLNDLRDGTSASLAPGSVNQKERRLDFYGTAQWQDFSAHLYWHENLGYGANQGLGGALDPAGELVGRRLSSDISWQREGVGQWDLEGRAAFLYQNNHTSEPYRTLPPSAFGNDPVTGQPLFPAGLLDDIEQAEKRTWLQLSALWHGWEGHRLRLGAGSIFDDFYKSRQRNNYAFTTPAAPPSPRPGGLTDVSDTQAVIVPEANRTGIFAFAQDEWQFARQWQLTTGVRYDHFSDFGAVTTPRLSLVWQTTPKFTSKLIYGEAFRAPSFNELYATGNSFALGNAALRPERLHSSELAFNYRPGPAWDLNLNLYDFTIDDFIDFLPTAGGPGLQARNAGSYRGRGVETELSYRHERVELRANASVQEVKNKKSDEDLGLAPRHQAYLRVGFDLTSQWQATVQVRHVGERKRQPGDPQPNLAGYNSIDTTLRRTVAKNAELYLIGRNLLDEDQREPGIAPVPESIPLPGRSIGVGFDMEW